MFMGLSLIISLSGRALLKGKASMAIGLLASLIGQDPLTGAARFTFGTATLTAGVEFISVIVGLFAISEVMINVEQRITSISRFDIGSWMPSWADIKQCMGAMVRCSGVGFFLGLLPGCAPSVNTFVAYDLEKRLSKHSERFGKEAIEGVAAPEGANNATSTAGYIPLFSFGLPTAPSMAVLLGGFMMYGLQPGPMLFATNPDFIRILHAQVRMARRAHGAGHRARADAGNIAGSGPSNVPGVLERLLHPSDRRRLHDPGPAVDRTRVLAAVALEGAGCRTG
jgi:putative tricarboxylic transport membrane protein